MSCPTCGKPASYQYGGPEAGEALSIAPDAVGSVDGASIVGDSDIPIPLNDAWRAFFAAFGDGEVPTRGANVQVGGRVNLVVNLETLLGIGGGSGDHFNMTKTIDAEQEVTEFDVSEFTSSPVYRPMGISLYSPVGFVRLSWCLLDRNGLPLGAGVYTNIGSGGNTYSQVAAVTGVDDEEVVALPVISQLRPTETLRFVTANGNPGGLKISVRCQTG